MNWQNIRKLKGLEKSNADGSAVKKGKNWLPRQRL
jgi:hypothetical protein